MDAKTTNITYEQACALLGYAALPLLGRESRELLVSWVQEETKSGTEPPTPEKASLARDQIEEFL